jgi:hypothetical protein
MEHTIFVGTMFNTFGLYSSQFKGMKQPTKSVKEEKPEQTGLSGEALKLKKGVAVEFQKRLPFLFQ